MKDNKYLIIIFILIIIGSSYFLFNLFNQRVYTVYFDTDNGNIINALEVRENDVIPTLPVAQKEGYNFLYWTLDNEVFDTNHKINANITLKAIYEVQETENIIVRFDTLGGEKISDLKIPKGSLIDELPQAQKEGYTFINWLYQNKKFDNSKSINHNITLIAKYEKNTEN